LVEEGRLARAAASREVLPRLAAPDLTAERIVEELGLAQVDDAQLLRAACRRAVEAHPKAAQDVRAGKEKAYGALMGFVMKETGGKANPQVIRAVLKEIVEQS
ncbi:MAG: Asp-tRNA(Asn)/Glu-tRNA(Gln) amidotransferase subunit GatB, partial [Planctomycetota bacterium]